MSHEDRTKAQLESIRQIATEMDEKWAKSLWDEFLAYCKVRNEAHERDGRKAPAPLFPDIWTHSDWCAAGVKLGLMKLDA